MANTNMTAHPWRSLFRRLGEGGVVEATVAFVIFVFSEVNSARATTWPQLLADSLLALFAGASGRWPLLGGIGTGISLSAALLLRPDSLNFVVFLMFIPVVSAGAHGRARLRDFFALWYLTTVILDIPRISGDSSEAIQSIFIFVSLMLGAWAIGRTIGRMRDERAEQQRIRVAALQSQRRGMARDLHDTVAYATTTMIMRAEQIKLRSDDPALINDLDFIITTGRRSVRDLRGMLETLRRNDPEFELAGGESPSPWRIVEVDEVLESRRAELAAHGLTLAVTHDVDMDEVPPSVREAVAKLVTEGTSNMVKHAAPGPCRVLIDRQDDMLEVVLTNRTHESTRRTADEGLGLLGATERVEALGGSLEATRTADTWILSAQFPLGAE